MVGDPNRAPPRSKRAVYLVQARLQLAVALPLAAIPLVLTLAQVAATYLLPGESLLSTMTAGETRRLLLRASVIYGVIATLAIAATAVFLTQRIAGPAEVIERAVRALRRGDYGTRLALRPRDELKSLALAVSELREHLRDRDAHGRRIAEAVSCRPASGDLAAARELLAQLVAPTTPEPRG